MRGFCTQWELEIADRDRLRGRDRNSGERGRETERGRRERETGGGERKSHRERQREGGETERGRSEREREEGENQEFTCLSKDAILQKKADFQELSGWREALDQA